MRYQSEHGFTHPVASSESDHYPEGRFSTKLHKPAFKDGKVEIVLDFELEEPYLEELIRERRARYTAMLYCRATLHQQTLASPFGAKQISASINTDLLRDTVEIHPLLVATDTIKLNTDSANPFYHGYTPVVGEGQPLAADKTWHFSMTVDSLPFNSIFQFIPDPDLKGPMKIEMDPSEPYVKIRVNHAEFKEMNINRQQKLTIPSIFSAALVEVIHHIQEMASDEPHIIPGWVDTIKRTAAKTNINLGPEGVNPFEGAQALLNEPFKDLPKFQMFNVEEQEE